MASGSDSITIARSKPRKRTLNCSPMRRRQLSIRLIGRASHQTVCTSGGTAGVGGSVLILAGSVTDGAGAGRHRAAAATRGRRLQWQLLDLCSYLTLTLCPAALTAYQMPPNCSAPMYTVSPRSL